MPKLSRRRMDLNKLSGYAVLLNSCQILAALIVLVLAIWHGADAFTGLAEQIVLTVLSCIVIFGAVVDIRDARSARRISDESDMLEEAYTKLSTLNGTLRAQRHDFMNHLQVVYSLMEMKDYGEAQDYMEAVYADIQRVSRTLKTASPALNALLASKLAECEPRGVAAHLSIGSAYADIPVPDWELCRVFSNIIDNALDAMKETPEPRLSVATSETLHSFEFSISNNGPRISKSTQDRIFVDGFSTKGEGRGMGLAIVHGIIEHYGGQLTLTSTDDETRFGGVIPKRAQAG